MGRAQSKFRGTVVKETGYRVDRMSTNKNDLSFGLKTFIRLTIAPVLVHFPGWNSVVK